MLALIEQQRLDISNLFQTGVAAADPFIAVKQAIQVHQATISLGRHEQLRTGNWSKIHLLAFGKAAGKMASAALDSLPLSLLANKGIVVTPYESVQDLAHVEVLGAGHPLPDAAGWQAAKQIAAKAKAAKADELVLVLVSGGGSALLPLPVDGISLAEKIATTDLLLASGANINAINCVRKHLSQLKGGGLAKFAKDADLHALILSDVLGDDVSAIASGPTVPDQTSFQDALDVLNRYQVWPDLPDSVKNYLRQGLQGLQPETPKADADYFHSKTYTLVGSNQISLNALVKQAQAIGYQVDVFSQQLCGEARIAAEKLLDYALKLTDQGLSQPIAIVAGGETTVSLGVKPGKGGRNQELALAFALAAERHKLGQHWTFLSGGTDGRDGPTDAAGAIVDPSSLQRMRQAGIEPLLMLQQHNAYYSLKASHDLLITGATGTNVADLQILLLHPNIPII